MITGVSVFSMAGVREKEGGRAHLLQQTVEDVPALKDEDDPHTISQLSDPDVLLAGARNVE